MAKIMKTKKPTKEIHQYQNHKPKISDKPPSWSVVRNIFTCKHLQTQQQQQQQQNQQQQQQQEQQQQQQQKQQDKQPQQKQKKKQKQKEQEAEHLMVEENRKKSKKMKCSGSLCSNTKVMHKPTESIIPSSSSPEDHKIKRAFSMGHHTYSSSTRYETSTTSSRSMKAPLKEINGVVSSTSSSSSSLFSAASSNSSMGNNNNNGGSFRGMPFRRFSGCYECRMVIDPVLGMTRDPSLRATICSCPVCGEIFMKPENLELHQAVRHAVSELGSEDTSKNIVEIIFQSSWLKKQTPICKIDRILKINNTPKTISNFESYRETIKAKAAAATKQQPPPKKHPRCVADGNELLRFHCTTFTCSLGLNGSSNLCCNSNSTPNCCNVCSVIKNGFKMVPGKGILTTATSGKAHDESVAAGEKTEAGEEAETKRAMLVCRVIAGRVKKSSLEGGGGNVDEADFDSVAGAVGVYSNLDELYVFNPKAILPCFVVIYRGF